MIVVDANVIVYAITVCDLTAISRSVIEHAEGVIVPRLWRHDCANALVVLSRSELISSEDATQVFSEALDAFIGREREVDPRLTLREALSSGLSVYDSEYVALARGLGCRLVTNDGRILTAVPDVALSLSAAARER